MKPCSFHTFLTGALAIAMMQVMASCTHSPQFSHDECNGIYYWKTTFAVNDSLRSILKSHDIRNVYIRMFDVVENGSSVYGEEAVIPNASLQFKYSEDFPKWMEWTDSLAAGTKFTPTVFITLDALKKMDGRLGEWAEKIVTRALNMCSYNRIRNVDGLQLDCDWTPRTEQLYFSLCDSVRSRLKQRLPDVHLSSTIRLHQLAKTPPPVDYGVLMVYNTGSFNDPDTKNSIIDRASVEPYLKYLTEYPLHLDVAYPTYSWYLLFRQRQFLGLIRDVNLADTALFGKMDSNQYRVKSPTVIGRTHLELGDVIRHESSNFDEVYAVKALIEDRLGGHPHSNILYHLDYNNLSKFTDNEIDSLYSVSR